MILTDDECRKVYTEAMELPVRNAVAVTRHIESAILDKLRQGVELPEPAGWMNKNGDVFSKKEAVGFNTSTMKPLCTVEAAHQYGDALALAAREQAIEEWRVHLLALWEKGDFDLKDALAASPQEQT